MSDFEKSNDNIFADLGDPEAEQTLVRAQILSRIIDIINERNFTEAETAETLGISKLEASQLIKGKLSRFSLEDLFHILNALDKDVEIILKPKFDAQVAKIRVLIEL